jgi:hypothetical protein
MMTKKQYHDWHSLLMKLYGNKGGVNFLGAMMNPSRAKALIQQWTQQQKLPPQHLNQALKLANITPTPQHWFSFLDKLLLANGGGLLVIGVIFFFAFNWQAITRFHKFALIEA